MNLRGTIKKILKEESEFSNQFKRRIALLKEFIYHCFVFQNPCDYEDFTQFMMGIHSEIEEYASGIYDSDDNNHTPDWLTYEEGIDFVETHMIDDLKSYYHEMCQNQDLNESKPDYIYFFGDEKETIQYGKILNKHMSKYDWWKGIKVTGISYNRLNKRISLNADLNVDEIWGEEQWKIYVNQTFPGNKEEVVLTEIVGGDLYYELREEFSKTFEFTFGLPVNSFVMNDISLNFISNRKEEETEYAVIEITKPIAHMESKYYYQEVPYWHTKENMIYIKKGSAGNKMISTKNIKVLKTFEGGNNPEMKEYLEKLRNK